MNTTTRNNDMDYLTRTGGLLLDILAGIILLPMFVVRPRLMCRLWANAFRNAF